MDKPFSDALSLLSREGIPASSRGRGSLHNFPITTIAKANNLCDFADVEICTVWGEKGGGKLQCHGRQEEAPNSSHS